MRSFLAATFNFKSSSDKDKDLLTRDKARNLASRSDLKIF